MKKQQVDKSEQILPNLSIVLDYDEPLTTEKEFLFAFNLALNNNCNSIVYGNKGKGKKKHVYYFEHNNIKEYFLTGSKMSA